MRKIKCKVKDADQLQFGCELLKGIAGTEMLDHHWRENPRARNAETHLIAVLNRVSEHISSELLDELWSAAFSLAIASTHADVLYGIRVANALHNMSLHPDAYVSRL